MTAQSERWEQAQRLFDAALEVPASHRDAFLIEACADLDLRGEVDCLLQAHLALEGGAGERFLVSLDAALAPALLASGEGSSGTVDPEGLSPGQMLGRYRIVRCLSRGGMGVVYLAHDVRLDRPVALKLLPRHLSLEDTARRRLEVEARATSALDHPHIATVYEIDEAVGGRVFLAMAWYEGETLRQRLERGPLPVVEATALAIQIADGLSAAHAHGIVHRDIKPGNVIVAPPASSAAADAALEAGGVVKILDFGIAKIAGSALTRTGTILGTVAYMSPEQTLGDVVDARTDLWSLGVVLYEMLTGVRPFRAEGEQALIYAIRHDQPKPIRRLRPEVPEGLANIVECCLSKDPADRYASAGALLADLRAGGVASAVSYARPEWRRRVVRYGSAVGLLVLLLGGTVALWPQMKAGVATPERIRSVEALAARRLAVLPLTNDSPDPEDAYFADGLTEGLISRLSQNRDLRVIAQSSAMRYKGSEKDVPEIGRELGVGTVLNGSVRKVGGRLHIAVQLVDARSEERLWSEDYEADVIDVLGVQREVARNVAGTLNVRAQEGGPSAGAETEDPEAYVLYLQGRYLLGNLNEASFSKALSYFQQALERDPGFALAWSGLADAYDHLAGQSALSASEAYPRARTAAERALALDPELPEAHSSLARTLSMYYWDSEAAEQHFRRAVELDPSYASAHQSYAEHLRNLGRFDEALAEIHIALELDPLAAYAQIEKGITLYVARRYDEALEQYQRLLRAAPAFAFAYFFVGLVYVQQGRHEEALDALNTMDPEERHPDAVAIRGVIHARAERYDEARRMIAKLDEMDLEQPVSAFHKAPVHVHLGEHERALELLEEAVEERAWHVRMLKVEPTFDPLRSDPRFQSLLDKVGVAG